VSRPRTCLIIAAVIALAVFALAFLVAPHACAGGFEFYFWCGVAAVCILVALPFITRAGTSMLIRVGAGLGLAVAGAGTWLTGMVAANVRFFCGMGYL
jgi:hypothetical protein